jgi:radical SAM protein with 4Fe4S-binding SPASM domain
MDTAAGKAFIKNLAEFEVPVILFSGGEPLLREDLLEMAGYAREQGLRIALSTNGTLITDVVARNLKQTGFAEIGISLDGLEVTNDNFRGEKGAFRETLRGIRNCVAQGLRVSLRLTITRFNYQEIPQIFQLVENEKIDRICFYHLAYSGRGGSLKEHDLNHDQTREVIDQISDLTEDLFQRGLSKEVLTVDNHADGVYLYLKTKKTQPERANQISELLRINGGNSSGIKIGAVDNLGNVHPDQFWWHYSLGNVLQRPFGEIWSDSSEPLLQGLRDRRKLLKGRCARCQHLDLCNGNLRVRAEAAYGDIWAEDPACYLSDEEIGVKL